MEETAEVYLHDKCQKGLLPGAAPSSRTADLPHYPFRGSHGGGFGDPQLSPSSQGLQVIELQGVEEAHSDRTEPQGNQERVSHCMAAVHVVMAVAFTSMGMLPKAS